MAKFPTRPPRLSADTTNDDCFNVSGPVARVVFTFCNSLKLIVDQPETTPHANVRRLPEKKNKFEWKVTRKL